jgi:hypothetical protein
MNRLKENPVLVAIIAFALVGTAATSFLALQSSARHIAAVDSFNSQINTLRRLQNAKPFPDGPNAQRVEESVAGYEKAVASFKSRLAALEAPLDSSITPQKFQDDLRAAVDDLRRKATEKGVVLPEEFFFGFNAYQTQLPSQEETPFLNREFSVIRRLVESLVDLPIASIDSLERLAKPAAEADSEKTTGDDESTEASEESARAPFDTFQLGITALQDKFIAAFNLIPEAGGFLVVRSMTIENTSPVPPPRAEPTPDPASASPFEADSSESQTLPVVFGRESVKATFLLEILDFPEPQTAAEPGGR